MNMTVQVSHYKYNRDLILLPVRFLYCAGVLPTPSASCAAIRAISRISYELNDHRHSHYQKDINLTNSSSDSFDSTINKMQQHPYVLSLTLYLFLLCLTCLVCKLQHNQLTSGRNKLYRMSNKFDTLAVEASWFGGECVEHQDEEGW